MKYSRFDKMADNKAPGVCLSFTCHFMGFLATIAVVGLLIAALVMMIWYNPIPLAPVSSNSTNIILGDFSRGFYSAHNSNQLEWKLGYVFLGLGCLFSLLAIVYCCWIAKYGKEVFGCCFSKSKISKSTSYIERRESIFPQGEILKNLRFNSLPLSAKLNGIPKGNISSVGNGSLLSGTSNHPVLKADTTMRKDHTIDTIRVDVQNNTRNIKSHDVNFEGVSTYPGATAYHHPVTSHQDNTLNTAEAPTSLLGSDKIIDRASQTPTEDYEINDSETIHSKSVGTNCNIAYFQNVPDQRMTTTSKVSSNSLQFDHTKETISTMPLIHQHSQDLNSPHQDILAEEYPKFDNNLVKGAENGCLSQSKQDNQNNLVTGNFSMVEIKTNETELAAENFIKTSTQTSGPQSFDNHLENKTIESVQNGSDIATGIFETGNQHNHNGIQVQDEGTSYGSQGNGNKVVNKKNSAEKTCSQSSNVSDISFKVSKRIEAGSVEVLSLFETANRKDRQKDPPYCMHIGENLKMDVSSPNFIKSRGDEAFVTTAVQYVGTKPKGEEVRDATTIVDIGKSSKLGHAMAIQVEGKGNIYEVPLSARSDESTFFLRSVHHWQAQSLDLDCDVDIVENEMEDTVAKSFSYSYTDDEVFFNSPRATSTTESVYAKRLPERLELNKDQAKNITHTADNSVTDHKQTVTNNQIDLTASSEPQNADQTSDIIVYKPSPFTEIPKSDPDTTPTRVKHVEIHRIPNEADIPTIQYQTTGTGMVEEPVAQAPNEESPGEIDSNVMYYRNTRNGNLVNTPSIPKTTTQIDLKNVKHHFQPDSSAGTMHDNRKDQVTTLASSSIEARENITTENPNIGLSHDGENRIEKEHDVDPLVTNTSNQKRHGSFNKEEGVTKEIEIPPGTTFTDIQSTVEENGIHVTGMDKTHSINTDKSLLGENCPDEDKLDGKLVRFKIKSDANSIYEIVTPTKVPFNESPYASTISRTVQNASCGDDENAHRLSMEPINNPLFAEDTKKEKIPLSKQFSYDIEEDGYVRPLPRPPTPPPTQKGKAKSHQPSSKPISSKVMGHRKKMAILAEALAKPSEEMITELETVSSP